MEATKEEGRTVAEVAKVKVEVHENEKLSWVLETIKTLHEEGVKDIQAVLHLSESQAPAERFETVSVGGTNWRRDILVPVGMPLEEQDEYIKGRALSAANAYAEGLKIVARAESEAKAAKGAN
jgi:hypothetical protein